MREIVSFCSSLIYLKWFLPQYWYLKQILLSAGPFSTEPVVIVMIRHGGGVVEFVVGVEREVEPGGIEGERGVEPRREGRGGRRRGGGHAARAPGHPRPRPARALRLDCRRADTWIFIELNRGPS